jgi:uncharacterized membrane protein YdbT with pleckstrin-like domain
MSPVGSIDGADSDVKLVLRPNVTKTLIKGVIAVALISPLLNIASNYFHYFLFLCLAFGALGLYVLVKHSSRFAIGDEDIQIKRIMGKSNAVSYQNIIDISISQGILARRFNCGSLYLILKQGPGGLDLMGGGKAERLEDIPDPNRVYELISSRLSPFST